MLQQTCKYWKDYSLNFYYGVVRQSNNRLHGTCGGLQQTYTSKLMSSG